ncbi:MAG: hypothetical protein JST35_06635 [Armatimonadetes bacterium]|jgi:hypothetical protein|nr:hypothetical protein [Armatimonadota bacterium]
MQSLFPTRSLMVFLLIGVVDLIVTAVLHAKGLIVELNPLMRVFIERSEWLFCLVKGATLVGAWLAMRWYAKKDIRFVNRLSWVGAVAYLAIWTAWFIHGSMQTV